MLLGVLTFTLPGFQTIRREGLELPANFTATINADMKVGSLEESITVTGSSPIVDVQTNSKSQVLSREVLDAVRPHVDDTGWAKLARALGIAAQPGLVSDMA